MDNGPSHTRAPEITSSTSRINEVNALIEHVTGRTKFPCELEASFQSYIGSTRISRFLKIGIAGIFIYDSFILTDMFIMPDIIEYIVIVQLLLVTPLAAFLMWAIYKQLLSPEIAVTAALLAIVASVILFLYLSKAEYSSLLIYTIPVCLAFGNVVLPLPFRMSLVFTVFCLATSSAALMLRFDWEPAFGYFILVVNANCAIYMLMGTYRMEASERRAFLFNQREALRAEALAESNLLLENLSKTDALTGLANRRHLDEELVRVCEAADGECHSLMMVDIDHFKKVNDSFGHDVGDQVLKRVGECLRRHAPPDAMIARFGGEEFAVLLPNGGMAYARSCAEVLRLAVARLGDGPLPWDLPTTVTISIGIAGSTPGLVPAAFIKAADQELYHAKAKGRNRVECGTGVATIGMRNRDDGCDGIAEAKGMQEVAVL